VTQGGRARQEYYGSWKERGTRRSERRIGQVRIQERGQNRYGKGVRYFRPDPEGVNSEKTGGTLKSHLETEGRQVSPYD